MPKYELWERRVEKEQIFLQGGDEYQILERKRHFQKTWECEALSWTEAQKLLEQEIANPTRLPVEPPMPRVPKPVAVPALKFKRKKGKK